ncbi:MAG: hypothetical protein JWR59_434 [Brevundimonas sp.]|nr:hypothetical protein [Brevundimonas sp.]
MSVRKPTPSEGLAIAWPVGALVIAAAIPVIGDWNPFFVPFVLLGWLGLGLLVLAGLLIARKWRAAGLLAILTPLVFFLGPVASSAGAQSWNQSQFQRSRVAYEDVVARAATLPDTGVMSGVSYRIERGAVTRIAFPLPAGVADNWSAVVHDPSDLVATAEGWGARPGDYTAHPDVRGLWGGNLVACTRITGHFYRCDFS